MTPNAVATSETLRAIGPPVSKLSASGTIPLRLSRPSVGLSPTMPLAEDGPRTEPPVSVPMPNWANIAAIDAPVPPLEPEGPRVKSCGLRVCKPMELKPLGTAPALRTAGSVAPLTLPPLPANSLRLTLATMITPASRNFFTTNASAGGTEPCSSCEPAVVGRSKVL